VVERRRRDRFADAGVTLFTVSVIAEGGYDSQS
jgi:hypothetical protein